MSPFRSWLGRLKRALGGRAGRQGHGASQNRYARDWNAYSHLWQRQFGANYSHLGDEWNDDATPQRERDQFYFRTYAERFLNKDMTVLEVGPGGGKWTVRLAPLVKRMVVMDVSNDMLRRTRERCESEKIANVEFLLGNGRDFAPVANDGIDFFFSYDVFVHIALEDTWPYALEMARVLKPGGVGVCHHAINSVPEAWTRIAQNNDWYRFGKNTLGQYYYYSPEALRRMYERTGMTMAEQHQEAWHCTCIFRKPSPDLVPRLERLLGQLAGQEANDERVRAELLGQLRSLQDALRESLEPVIVNVLSEQDADRRMALIARIRSMWRGM